VAVLISVGIAFNAYMPVMLAVMEIPGCLLALYLVALLRHRGMDAAGFMPDEPGYTPRRRSGSGPPRPPSQLTEMALTPTTSGGSSRSWRSRWKSGSIRSGTRPMASTRSMGSRAMARSRPCSHARLLQEVLLNPGLCLLVGGITIGFISTLQGQKVVHDNDTFFVAAFEGALTLFLLEMGMTASRKLRDLKTAGRGFIFFGLLAPNLFATLGITVAYSYAYLTDTHFKPGTYVLFAVLCGAASYITVPAVQRLAIPEASPTLPLAASLGLTFSYTVTIGIPLYIEISRVVGHWFPGVT